MKFAKLDKQRQSEIRSSVYFLRFRTESPSFKAKVFSSYATISRTLAVPYNTVQHLCRYALKTKRKPKKDKEARRLDQEQIDFLLKKETHILWAGRTLKERTVLFYRRFPHKKIAVTSLRRLYLANGIKRKIVR